MKKKTTTKEKLAEWWKWSDLADVIRGIGTVIGVLVGLVVAFWVLTIVFTSPMVAMDYVKCNEYAPQTRLDYKFDWWKGCLLKTADGWVEYDNYLQSIEIRQGE